jgi:hypothetical protein
VERRVRVADDLRAPVPDLVERDFVARDLLEPDVLDAFFEPARLDFVSPFSARVLFTVRAATSSARPP